MENEKRKICIVTGNRAEYSRLKTVIQELHKIPTVEVLLVVMGSHLLDEFGNTLEDIGLDGHKINHKIFMELEGRNPCTMARSIGLATCDLATYFDNVRPDIVIAPMDRYEILAVATAAATMNIPIAHMQGGEASGTIDESIRHVITKFSHIHFPATEQSRERIIKMGERHDLVFNVGDPATDLLLKVPVLTSEETIRQFNERLNQNLNPDIPFILALQHPVTTEFGNGLKHIEESLRALKRVEGHNIIFLAPNIDAGGSHIYNGIENFIIKHKMDNLAFLKHIPRDVFVNLMRNAKCMFGNSSSGIRESCYFGTPTINIGTRQQNRERGENVMDAPYDENQIYEVLLQQINHGRYAEEYIYGDGHAGERIAKILATINLKDIEVQKKITY